MDNHSLDQKHSVCTGMVADTLTKIQRKSHPAIPGGSILERLFNFAFSVPDFRRTDRGNLRHALGDIIILMIFARMARCVGRADMIEFGRHNLKKFQSMILLKNGVLSEPTLCRVENGIDEMGFANKMAGFSKAFNKELVKAFGQLEIICIDGKAMCGTVQANGRPPPRYSLRPLIYYGAHIGNRGLSGEKQRDKGRTAAA